MKCTSQKKIELSLKYNKKRGIRKRKTPFQQEQLVKKFQKDKFISDSDVSDLAAEIGMEIKQVKDWFRNRRRRTKIFGSESDNHTESDN